VFANLLRPAGLQIGESPSGIHTGGPRILGSRNCRLPGVWILGRATTSNPISCEREQQVSLAEVDVVNDKLTEADVEGWRVCLSRWTTASAGRAAGTPSLLGPGPAYVLSAWFPRGQRDETI